jgi:hypothetical protein
VLCVCPFWNSYNGRSYNPAVLMHKLIPSASALPLEGLSKHIQVHFTDFQNLIVKVQMDAVPRMAGERFAVAAVKIEACRNLRTLISSAKRRTVSYECPATSGRTSGEQENEALVSDCKVFSDRSQLPGMASAEKLSAALCPVSGHNA